MAPLFSLHIFLRIMKPEWVPQVCFALPLQGKLWCGLCYLRRCVRLTCYGPFVLNRKVSCGANSFEISANHVSEGNSEFLTCTLHFARNRFLSSRRPITCLSALVVRLLAIRKSFRADRIYRKRGGSSHDRGEPSPNYSTEENTRHALWPPKPKLFFIALRIFMARGWNGT